MVIPVIDPNVKYCGVSELRKLNSERLRTLTGALVIQDNGEPLAVIISYETFLTVQRSIEDGVTAIASVSRQAGMKF